MLEVPSYHPCINNVEIYLEIFSSSWLDERELHVGMLFRDEDKSEKAVKLYSCRRQRMCSTRQRWFSWASCKASSCEWSLSADKTKENDFLITEYRGPHTCEPVDVASDFLAGEIKCLIKAQPSLSIAELSKLVKEEFDYTVSHSNWKYDPFPDPKDASFRSLFFAFQQSVEGFPHCRPLILVDTVDLNGKYPGKLLVATGLDAENALFPLAFAIITQESLSADTWRWFFACIRKKVTQREGLCLITSLNPDIVAVVKEPECQWVTHRFCLRHLCIKFYDVFNNNLLTEFFCKAGSTSYISSFNYYLKKIKEMNPEARKWLDQIPPHQWALAHDDEGLRFGITDTNLIFTTYGFVNNVHDLPITTCVLLIFEHLLELFKSRHGLLGESLSREVYAKHVVKKLEEYKVTSRTYDVLPLDQTRERFQVTEVLRIGNKKSFVHCSDRVCTCGIWQHYKYPCPHMIAVCRRLNIDHMQYVNDFYNAKSFLGVYASDFNPLPKVTDWPEASDVPRLFPPGSRPIHQCPVNDNTATV
ncbi:hypothetical protein CARUB_v10006438mg [Capsella rubella]|uniref:SWIM-type domain-containing protein n=1 Tax=Capsella rubella TaxID=81985 RepID=R0H3D8_9BRAS|nr:hypothetical protein CARUB_v10006438mg [Capsella rubella]